MPEAGRFRKNFVNTGPIRVPSQAVADSPRAFAAAEAGSARRVAVAACPVAGRETIPCGPWTGSMRPDHAARGAWRRGPGRGTGAGRQRRGRCRCRAPAADPWTRATAGGRRPARRSTARAAAPRRCRVSRVAVGEAREEGAGWQDAAARGGRAAARIRITAGAAGIAGPGSTPRRSPHCGSGPGHGAPGARFARSRAASSRARA